LVCLWTLIWSYWCPVCFFKFYTC